MKAVLIIVGAIAVLVAGAVVVGYLLPRDHVVAMNARIDGSPDSVWAVVTNPSVYPTWRPQVTKVDLLPPVPTGRSWRESTSDGTITYVATVSDPPHRLVTEIADKNLPFGGQWEYRIEALDSAGRASIVTITERGSVYNPIYRFVSRFVMGHTATIDAYLRALSKRFGSEAVPVEVGADGTNPVDRR